MSKKSLASIDDLPSHLADLVTGYFTNQPADGTRPPWLTSLSLNQLGYRAPKRRFGPCRAEWTNNHGKIVSVRLVKIGIRVGLGSGKVIVVEGDDTPAAIIVAAVILRKMTGDKTIKLHATNRGNGRRGAFYVWKGNSDYSESPTIFRRWIPVQKAIDANAAESRSSNNPSNDSRSEENVESDSEEGASRASNNMVDINEHEEETDESEKGVELSTGSTERSAVERISSSDAKQNEHIQTPPGRKSAFMAEKWRRLRQLRNAEESSQRSQVHEEPVACPGQQNKGPTMPVLVQAKPSSPTTSRLSTVSDNEDASHRRASLSDAILAGRSHKRTFEQFTGKDTQNIVSASTSRGQKAGFESIVHPNSAQNDQSLLGSGMGSSPGARSQPNSGNEKCSASAQDTTTAHHGVNGGLSSLGRPNRVYPSRSAAPKPSNTVVQSLTTSAQTVDPPSNTVTQRITTPTQTVHLAPDGLLLNKTLAATAKRQTFGDSMPQQDKINQIWSTDSIIKSEDSSIIEIPDYPSETKAKPRKSLIVKTPINGPQKLQQGPKALSEYMKIHSSFHFNPSTTDKPKFKAFKYCDSVKKLFAQAIAAGLFEKEIAPGQTELRTDEADFLIIKIGNSRRYLPKDDDEAFAEMLADISTAEVWTSVEGSDGGGEGRDCVVEVEIQKL